MSIKPELNAPQRIAWTDPYLPRDTRGMNGNGSEAEWREQQQVLLSGAASVDYVAPILVNAAKALERAAQALSGISDQLSTVGARTARAISDTMAIRRTLKDITDREQALCVEIGQLRDEIEQRDSILAKPKVRKAVRKQKRKQ